MWVWRSASPPAGSPGRALLSLQRPMPWPCMGPPGISVTSRGSPCFWVTRWPQSGSRRPHSPRPPARSEPLLCAHAMSSCLLSPSLQWPLPGRGAGRGRPRPGRPPCPQPCVCPTQGAALLRKGTVLLAEQRHLPWGARLSGVRAREQPPSARTSARTWSTPRWWAGLEKVVYRDERCAALSPARGPRHAWPWRAAPTLGFPQGSSPTAAPCSSRLSMACPEHDQLPFQSRGRPSKGGCLRRPARPSSGCECRVSTHAHAHTHTRTVTHARTGSRTQVHSVSHTLSHTPSPPPSSPLPLPFPAPSPSLPLSPSLSPSLSLPASLLPLSPPLPASPSLPLPPPSLSPRLPLPPSLSISTLGRPHPRRLHLRPAVTRWQQCLSDHHPTPPPQTPPHFLSPPFKNEMQLLQSATTNLTEEHPV